MGYASYRHTQEATIHDQRMILRSCALALLPAGQSQYQEIIEVMQIVAQHSKLDSAMLFEAYTLLQRSCIRHLKIGPVDQLTQTIDHSVRLFAA